jgi:hypothetical protein
LGASLVKKIGVGFMVFCELFILNGKNFVLEQKSHHFCELEK